MILARKGCSTTSPPEPNLLTFVMPVRHQATTKDWPGIKRRLAVTLRSLCAQTSPDWNAIIVVNQGADLPALPDERITVLHVDFPPAQLPDAKQRAAYLTAVRIDKGNRILAGLIAARPAGHVMFTDCDDLVSCNLAGLPAANPAANGWFFTDGYIFSGGAELYPFRPDFFMYCGTSHIVRADLLRIPARLQDADADYVSQALGSHVHIKKALDAAGTPLAPLPFAGAIYRTGHSESTHGSAGVKNFLRLQARDNEARYQQLLSRLCPLDETIRAEFFAGSEADAKIV